MQYLHYGETVTCNAKQNDRKINKQLGIVTKCRQQKHHKDQCPKN